MMGLARSPLRHGPHSPANGSWSVASVARCIPKRFVRLIILALLVVVGLFIPPFLRSQLRRSHHAPYELPAASFDPLVHGVHVSEASREGPAYPLHPFPDSPMRQVPPSSEFPNSPSTEWDAMDRKQQLYHDGRPNPWLAAVICRAADADRRMLIRSTWMRMYRDVPFDGRFVVSNPGHWADVVRMENQTFGDMIVLDHLPEDNMTSHTIKTIELYKWLLRHRKHYDFVSKIDADTFVNARALWDRYLLPRIANVSETELAWRPGAAPPPPAMPLPGAERTIIAELYYSRTHDLVFPHGSIYTLTWDLVELLTSLQDQYHVVAGEDMTMGVLMLKARERANVVSFRGSEKFDYDDGDSRGDGTAWARDKTHPNALAHAVGSDAVAVHELKDSEHWIKVADCFDERGVKEAPFASGVDRTPWSVRWHDFWYSLGFSSRWQSAFDRIPDFFWSFENGTWVCDGIWNVTT